MKFKITGYHFDKQHIPKALEAPLVYDIMSQTPGGLIGGKFLYGAKMMTFKRPSGEQEKWWAGIVMKIRDAKAFTKMTKNKNNRIITSHKLGDNETMAEVNFFLANPETGSGLYTYHYQSVSMTDFGWICLKLFKDHAEKLIEAECKAVGDSQEEKKKIRDKYRGALYMNRLVRSEDFKALLKKLKKLNSVKTTLTTVAQKSTLFRGISEFAKSETVSFNFVGDADIDVLSDRIADLVNSSEVADISVMGHEEGSSSAKSYKPLKNPLIFYEYEYDQVMNDLNINLDDWNASIEQSTMIQRLHKASLNESIHTLLVKT